MHLILAVLAVGLILLGFVGLGLGVVPTIVFWLLAAVCIIGAWRSRPSRLRAREERLAGPPAH